MKIYIHVNRHELRKGKKGKPWTLHTSKGCIPAREVVVDPRAGNVFAQCYPERKRNPKCFLVVQDAKIKNMGKGKFRIVSKGETTRVAMGATLKDVPVSRIYRHLIGPVERAL
jgi:hypothetical protein